VDAGADINVVNPQGINMLHIAAQGDQASSIIYFLEAGANINMTDKRGSTPLHWAVYSNSEVAASYLLAHKAQLNLQDNDGNSPLHAAVKYGYQNKNSRIARLLLLQGAKRDIRNGKGKIALHVLYEVSIDGANRELRTQFEKILVYL
jgi:ankyrin repeat protein